MPTKNLTTSRAIIGQFYYLIEQDLGLPWVSATSMLFNSDQESENYRWLGQVPGMRKWVGGRMTKSLRDAGLTVTNEPYESTLVISMDDMRRDKTGQIAIRIGEQVQRAQAHWAELLSTLIVNGATVECYDGQYFFDTDHSEGDSGTQNNDLTGAAATGTQPTAVEMTTAITDMTAAMVGFKDDWGYPMNAEARRFLVMVPTVYLGVAANALGSAVLADTVSRTNPLMPVMTIGGFKYELMVNPRLTSGAAFYMFRTDGEVKPFIRQVEVDIEMSAQAEGSPIEFANREHQYGIYTSRSVNYGYWQHACMYTFT